MLDSFHMSTLLFVVMTIVNMRNPMVATVSTAGSAIQQVQDIIGNR